MSVVVIGLNCRTAPLPLLERMTVSGHRLTKALHDLSGRDYLREIVILSTCNRTEVYALAEKFHGGYQDIRNFFSELAFLPPEEFGDHLYVHYDDAAVAHLFGVAAGIDSVVVGESEILGQVASAWQQAQDEGAAGPGLNLLFRHALEVGKRARTETGIGRHITSVAQAAVAMATERLGDDGDGPGGLADRRVLVLGAGEMGEQMAAALAQAGVADIAVANRTWAHGAALARRIGGRAVRLGDLEAELARTDVLLTSTGAAAVVVDRDDLEPVMEARNGRALLVVDIAVPRDVDPSVRDLPGVTLLDMDDIRAFADAGKANRRREVSAVRAIIDEEADRYLALASERKASPLIAGMHNRAEAIRQSELARFASRLDGLDPKQRQAVESLTKGIVAKLLREPTMRLKGTAGSATGDRLAESLRDLFDLDLDLDL